MIQINPLKSYIDGGVRAALTTPPSASLVFDLPGKAIWVKGVKLKGTDHTYIFNHDNYITLTNTPDKNNPESEDIKIGVNITTLKNVIDTTYSGGTLALLQEGLNTEERTWLAKILHNYINDVLPVTKNLKINGTNYAIYTTEDSLPLFFAPTSLGTTGQILACTSSGLSWINLIQNTDYRVSLSSATSNSDYRIILKQGADNNPETDFVRFSEYLTFNPYTKTLKINNIKVVTATDIYVGSTAGLVPAATSAQLNYYLRGDGAWVNIATEMAAANTWRPIKVENTDALGSGTSTGTLSFIAGTGITLSWDATNKRIIITNSSPDVNHNTDENVRQVPKTDDVNRPLMMINGSTSAGEQINTSMFSTGIYANASTKMITANGFIKAGSSDNYVLLGGGGHKAESSLSVANADTVDGIDSTGFLRYYNSNSAPSNVDIVNTPSYVWTVSTTGGSVANATKPSGIDNAWGVIHLHTHIGNFATQLGFGGTTNRMYMRNAYNTSTFGNWQALAFITDNVASATKLQTTRTIWGQSFNGTTNVDNTLRIRQTTGNYCEGIRIQTTDGAWSTIILGATADSGTNTNAWSIHRKDDNNFAISRNSSDGVNGLVMTSTGMGLGTISPTQRLDVAGNIRTTGNLYISHATNNNMNHDTSNPRVVFSENGSLAVGLVYTDYDSYRSSKGLKVMDVDNNDSGNVWFEVLGYNYSSGYVKNGSSDNYVLLGGGSHKALSDFSMAHSHPYLPLSGGTMVGPIKFAYNDNGNCNVSRTSGFSMFYGNQENATNYGFPFRYSSVISFMTAYCGMQFANYGGNGDTRLLFRNISDLNTWTNWYYILHSGNSSVTKSGQTITVTINGTSQSLTNSTYNFSGASFTSGNYNTAEHNANNITSNGVWYYTSNGPTISLGASTNDGALYSQAYNSNWVGQIALDYRDGDLFTRGKNNGTWTTWKRIAYINDIPTVTDYYWANVKISSSSNAYTTPQFGSVTIHDGTNSFLYLKTTAAGAYAYLAAYNTGGQYGADVILHSGSAMILGAGESAAAMYSNNVDSLRGSENLYLTADSSIKIFTNCDSIANRKYVACFDTTGYTYFNSYINIGGHEKNASSPTYVWGSNASDNFLRSYQTNSLSVGKAANADYATCAPAAANWGGTGSTTKIKVKINRAASWMLSFVVTLYQDYKATKIMISGYNYGSNYWYQPEAVLLGDSNGATSISVYFGYDSAYNLWVGFDGGSYTGVSITDVTNGYTQISSLKELFTISNVSSLTTLQKTVTATNSVYHADYSRYVYCTSGKYLNFQWSGQSGLPTWLFGSNDGTNVYVWNPSNFSVNYANSAGNATIATTANKLAYTDLDNGVFTVALTSDNFVGRSGWATYLIGNHGNGSTYYHQIIAMPFWGMPQYLRLEGGTLRAWYTFAMMGYNNEGNFYAAHFYENSDIRYKNNIKVRNINIDDLASIPIFDYNWKDSDELSTGTSALDVLKILPTLVTKEEYLTLNYGVLGTIAGVTACKELVTLKSELLQLKEKVKLLEDKLRKYENTL